MDVVGSPEAKVAGEVSRRPVPTGGLRHFVAGLVLRAGGWTPEGDPPELPKYVIVAAPHTWWWDGFWMVAFAWWWNLEVAWLVKRSATWGPFGPLLRWLGAIAVDRSGGHGHVRQIAAEFARREKLLVSIPPEGTRARASHWRSGFYHIALEADVPVCLSYLDYATKKGGFGLSFRLTGDVVSDMDRVREFYRDVRGRVPERFTPPRLKEEDEGAAR